MRAILVVGMMMVAGAASGQDFGVTYAEFVQRMQAEGVKVQKPGQCKPDHRVCYVKLAGVAPAVPLYFVDGKLSAVDIVVTIRSGLSYFEATKSILTLARIANASEQDKKTILASAVDNAPARLSEVQAFNANVLSRGRGIFLITLDARRE